MRILVEVKNVSERLEMGDNSEDIATIAGFVDALRMKFEITESFYVLVFDREFEAYVRLTEISQINNLAKFKVIIINKLLMIFGCAEGKFN